MIARIKAFFTQPWLVNAARHAVIAGVAVVVAGVVAGGSQALTTALIIAALAAAGRIIWSAVAANVTLPTGAVRRAVSRSKAIPSLDSSVPLWTAQGAEASTGTGILPREAGPVEGADREQLADRSRRGFYPIRKRLIRRRMHLNARYYINHNDVNYAEVRPMQTIKPVVYKKRRFPRTQDCSEFVTYLGRISRAPDPNGLSYNGLGFTGSELATLRHIPLVDTRRGDLVVFGAGTGKHVVMLLQGGRRRPDPLVISHGRPGIDVMPLSSMRAGFPGDPVTCLSLLD